MGTVEATGIVLIMLLAVVVSRVLGRLTTLPVPLLQVALGALIFYSPLNSVDLDPEVFFVLLLPPLLFLDGWRIPRDELLREAPTILTLALGLVVFTVLGVGLWVHWLVPAMPLPVCFALAAVVSPTDPVALSAIIGRVPMPVRMRHILEGESLFNDATGLVCMRVAVAAALTGAFSLPGAVGSFLWVASGGVAVGVAVTWLVTRAHAGSTVLLGDDGAAQILLTLLIPSGSYLLAETLQCSGILAAVAAGITMGATPHSHWHAVTRIRRTAVWDTVQFAANGSIFVLLGEQIPAILARAPQTVRLTGHHNAWWLALYVVLVVAALGLLRFVWVWTSIQLTFVRSRLRTGTRPRAPARLVLAMSLAGVRGAITLAGVLTLPVKTGAGLAFPGRDLAIFLATGVIVLTLLLASIALPRTLRGLTLAPEGAQWRIDHQVRLAAAQAGLRAVELAAQGLRAQGEDAALVDPAMERISVSYRQRMERYAETEEAPAQPREADRLERSLWLAGLAGERAEVLEAGPGLGLPAQAMGRLMREIDLQEARHSG